ncbi:MAG: hypothetical protein V1709_03620 [Planctomycetota bacterium]
MSTNQDQSGGGEPDPIKASQSQTDWRESLPPELKSEKTFEKFKDVSGLAKSYIEAEKTVSRALNAKGIIVPGEKSTPAEWDAYYKALGRPDKPDDYKLEKPTLPEGMAYDENKAKAFAQVAHKEGLTTKQLTALHNSWNEMVKTDFEAQIKAGKDFLDQSTVTMKKEWDKDFDSNLAKADAAIERIFGDEFKKVLKDTGLANHPVVIRGMFKAAQAIGEHSLITKGSEAKTTTGYTREKLISMKLDPRYSDPGRKDPAYIKEVEEYNKRYAESLGATG